MNIKMDGSSPQNADERTYYPSKPPNGGYNVPFRTYVSAHPKVIMGVPINQYVLGGILGIGGVLFLVGFINLCALGPSHGAGIFGIILMFFGVGFLIGFKIFMIKYYVNYKMYKVGGPFYIHPSGLPQNSVYQTTVYDPLSDPSNVQGGIAAEMNVDDTKRVKFQSQTESNNYNLSPLDNRKEVSIGFVQPNIKHSAKEPPCVKIDINDSEEYSILGKDVVTAGNLSSEDNMDIGDKIKGGYNVTIVDNVNCGDNVTKGDNLAKEDNLPERRSMPVGNNLAKEDNLPERRSMPVRTNMNEETGNIERGNTTVGENEFAESSTVSFEENLKQIDTAAKDVLDQIDKVVQKTGNDVHDHVDQINVEKISNEDALNPFVG